VRHSHDCFKECQRHDPYFAPRIYSGAKVCGILMIALKNANGMIHILRREFIQAQMFFSR
jgi:hypothetical protein